MLQADSRMGVVMNGRRGGNQTYAAADDILMAVTELGQSTACQGSAMEERLVKLRRRRWTKEATDAAQKAAEAAELRKMQAVASKVNDELDSQALSSSFLPSLAHGAFGKTVRPRARRHALDMACSNPSALENKDKPQHAMMTIEANKISLSGKDGSVLLERKDKEFTFPSFSVSPGTQQLIVRLPAHQQQR
jgi:hypothetical protein